MPLRPMTEQEKLDIEVGKMLRTKVANNPTVRRDLYRTLKKVDPQVRWPDQDIEDFKESFRKEQRDKELAQEVEKQKQEMLSQRQSVLDKFGEDHLKKIEALMQKHGIYDYEVGAKLYNAEAPPPSQASDYSSRTRWTMPTDADLIKDPAKWANDMAHKTIAEMRAQKGIPGGRNY